MHLRVGMEALAYKHHENNNSEYICCCCCCTATSTCSVYLQEKNWTELENKNKVVQKNKLHGLEEHVLIIIAASLCSSREVKKSGKFY